MRIEQMVVREVRPLAEHEQRRYPDVLEARRLRRHLSVRGHDCGLAVAVADATVVSCVDVRGQILDDEIPRSEVKLALDVALVDELVEGDEGQVPASVLSGREPDMAGEEDRGIEKYELRNEL